MPTGTAHTARDPRSDEQLVDAVNRRGPDAADAFDALYYRYRDWVANLAFRYTRDRELALDVMQETFIYLMNKFDDDGGFTLTAKMTTFLFPVVRHTAIRQRDKAHRAQGDPEPLAATLTDHNPGPDAEDPREALGRLMASLPEAQRECVLLRFVDGLNLDEIAQALDVPTGTVKSRLHHALNTLRNDPRVREYFEPA